MCVIELLIGSPVALGNKTNIDKAQQSGLVIIIPFLPQTNWGPPMATHRHFALGDRANNPNNQLLLSKFSKSSPEKKESHFINQKYK